MHIKGLYLSFVAVFAVTSTAADLIDTINGLPVDSTPEVNSHQFDFNSDPSVGRLLAGNRQWANGVKARDPTYFSKLAASQDPKVLWIGCSDSREAVTSITGTGPGDIFVHRNIGNIFYEEDPNMLAVLQYTIEYLKINHIVVVGHTHCGAVKSALAHKSLGMIDNWLRKIQNVYSDHRNVLDQISDEGLKEKMVSVLNAKQSAENIARTSILQKAWLKGKNISVHAWLFDIDSGEILDTKSSITGPGDLDPKLAWSFEEEL